VPAGESKQDGSKALRRARWVQPGEQAVQLPAHAAYLARRQLVVAGPVRRATVWATALGVYELHLNGTRIGDALLRPGWTDYSRRVQYQTYDVTDALVEGVNVIGAVVGPGWYAGKIGTDRGTRLTPRTPELLVALEVEAADGETTTVVTDESWEWRGSEVVSSDLYDGDVIDLRLVVPGWCAGEAADLGAWESVEISPGTAASLVAESGPPIAETDTHGPASVTWLDDSVAVVDMGRNEAGFLRLHVDAAPGARVQVAYGELLDVDGRVYTENLRTANCVDTFFCAGGGDEELAPRFSFRGARYAQVTGLAGKGALISVERAVIGSDVARVGWFESSDQLLNDIYACVLTSQRANFLEVPTDCPQRDERLGWMADAMLFAPLAAYNYDISEFMAKWFDDVLDARSSEGGFTDVAPRPTGRVMFRNREGAPAWADAGVALPWLVYRRYGRRDLLERMFPAMVRWLRIVHGSNPDGVWRRGLGRDYGDWVPAGPDTSHDLFATAWLAHSTALAAEAATLLGDTSEAAWLTERAGAARDAFNREFVDAVAGRVRARNPVSSPAAARRFAPSVVPETQTGYVLALMFDLVDSELAPRLADRLAEMVTGAGGRLQTGFIGSALLLDALAKGGHPSLAVDLLLREEYPSLGYMVDHGATSVWERWDGIQPDTGGPASATMNSFNHYCLGSMFRWAIESLCGLKPGDDVAFASFDFAPTLTSRIDWAAFRFLSPAGEIAVRWERIGDDTVAGEVTVPDGAECRIAADVVWDDVHARLDTASLPDRTVRTGTHRVVWRRQDPET
jgi:alpha-L-rhamnosidase